MLVTLGLTERVKAFTARPHYGEIMCHFKLFGMCDVFPFKRRRPKLDLEDNRR